MYDAEYIRELTAARKANEVARALIADHERTIVAQRAELEKSRVELREWWDERRVLCDELSADPTPVAGQTLVDALRAVQRERDKLRAEAGLLYKTLQEIRRDVHFAYRTEDSEHKWAELCMSIVAQVDDVTPNGTAGAQEARRLWDETRCRVCGWPLAESEDRGCVPGNCSMRPVPAVRADAGYERDALRARIAELEAQK